MWHRAAIGHIDLDNGPVNGGDITSLLQILPAMPTLRTARVFAFRRSVGPVDMCCMSYLEHVALVCIELVLVSAGSMDPIIGPKSFHLIAQ